MNTVHSTSSTLNFYEDNALETRIYNFLDSINVQITDSNEKEN